MIDTPFAAGRGGTVKLRLDADDVRLAEILLDELRALIADPEASGDAVMKRLRPAAHPDDPAAEEEYRDLVGGQLDEERGAAADVLASTIRDNRKKDGSVRATLSSEEVEAWMISLNHLRLAIGTVLDVQQDVDLAAVTTPEDPKAAQVAVYAWLTYVLEALLDVANPKA